MAITRSPKQNKQFNTKREIRRMFKWQQSLLKRTFVRRELILEKGEEKLEH
jgi:hypothetical protein